LFFGPAAVHEPYYVDAFIVAPDDIGISVAVEIARCRNEPGTILGKLYLRCGLTAIQDPKLRSAERRFDEHVGASIMIEVAYPHDAVAGGHRQNTGFAHRCSIHVPDGEPAVARNPHQVGAPVTIEIVVSAARTAGLAPLRGRADISPYPTNGHGAQGQPGHDQHEK